jgi:hypothetical protein
MAAGHWQSIREAADELGVAPETLTRRLRSGRPEHGQSGVPDVEAGYASQEEEQGAPLPPSASTSAPRPQPQRQSADNDLPPPLPKPPLCTLPPGKPLPPSGWVVAPPPRPQPAAVPAVPLRRASDAAAIAAAAAASSHYVPPRDRIDDAFMAAVEQELKELRSQRQGAAVVPAAPAVKPPEPSRATAPVLDMAHPLHAQVQDSKKQIRSMWIGIALLLLAVFGGALWTTVRMDRAEQMISSLIQQLDSERTLSAGYKQEITRLFQTLTDTRAEQSKRLAATRDEDQGKHGEGRLTSGK